jgi:hypothetical protein
MTPTERLSRLAHALALIQELELTGGEVWIYSRALDLIQEAGSPHAEVTDPVLLAELDLEAVLEDPWGAADDAAEVVEMVKSILTTPELAVPTEFKPIEGGTQ